MLSDKELIAELQRLKNTHKESHSDFLLEFINLIRDNFGIDDGAILRSAHRVIIEAYGRKNDIPIYTMESVKGIASPEQPKMKPMNVS